MTGNRRENWQREPVNSEVYRVALADGAIQELTKRNGPDNGAVVSPDGKSIAYLSFEDQFLGYQNAELNVMELDGSNSRSLTASLDRTIDDATWARDGRSLYVQYDDKAITKIARVSLNGRVETVAEGLGGGSLDRPYTGGQFTVANNGAVAFTSGSTQRPTDISIARGGRVRQLTHLNDGLLSGKTLGEVKPLKVTSSFDQRDDRRVARDAAELRSQQEVSADPRNPRRAVRRVRAAFSTDYQLYAAAGYAVLYTNPRGSTSYGHEFANLIHHKYPGQDYDDLMSAVDAAIAEGYVDADNLFVTGGSGGGVLTAWIVGKTTRFKAAVTQKPVINWASTVLTTDVAPFMPKYWFGKLPWEDPDAYWKRSPLSLVGAVKTPTLVLVGDQDFRTPLSDSEQYYQALQLAGVPTGLIKVPGASHGGLTARPSQSAAKASAILAWFERYRGKEPAKPAPTLCRSGFSP